MGETEAPRDVPRAPKLQPLAEDIERIANKLPKHCPIISVENVGPHGFDALVRFPKIRPVVEDKAPFRISQIPISIWVRA